MKFLQGLVAMVAMVGLAASAGAAPLATLTIDSFGFAMNHTNAAEGGSDDNSANVINMDIVMGGYQGGFGSSTDADKTAGIVGFEFGYFGPVAAYTTGPDAAPSGDITGGVLTVDLSAWTAYWNGTAFNQGGSTSGTMVTTYNSVTGAYCHLDEAHRWRPPVRRQDWPLVVERHRDCRPRAHVHGPGWLQPPRPDRPAPPPDGVRQWDPAFKGRA